MNKYDLDNAVNAAIRFISAADKVKFEITPNTGPPCTNGGKEAATAKRASMDLTRALVAIRRAN